MFENLTTRQTSTRRNQSAGFTLIELLLVIAIIAVLSSMALGVMAKAQDDARASATESRILMIENLLAMQLEDYEVRRLPISVRELGQYYDANVTTLTVGMVTQPKFVAVQSLRRRILADIINSEFPRPFLSNTGSFLANDDVGFFPTTNPAVGVSNLPAGYPDNFSDWLDNFYPNPVNGVTLRIRLAQLVPSRVQSYGPMKNPSPQTDPDFDLPGEYLYAALERMDVDGTPATELLGRAAIGNTDEDGYPEVIDAWGQSMQLRIWQINAELVEQDSNGDDLVDVWNDFANPDFELSDGSGFPTGYTPLTPIVPRVLQKIRFEVVSPRLGRNY